MAACTAESVSDISRGRVARRDENCQAAPCRTPQRGIRKRGVRERCHGGGRLRRLLRRRRTRHDQRKDETHRKMSHRHIRYCIATLCATSFCAMTDVVALAAELLAIPSSSYDEGGVVHFVSRRLLA